MTPALTVQFSAAADGRAVSIDEDCTLSTMDLGGGSTIVGVVSKDPKTTIANSVTAPGNSADESIIGIVRSGNEVNPAFPLATGETIFVSSSGASSIVLYFQLKRPL